MKNAILQKKYSILTIVFLILISVPVVFPYFKLQAINTYDTLYRLTRAAKYYVAIKQGQVPPRWIGDTYHGVGEPIFVYLYPFPYMLTTILHVLKFPFVTGLNILTILSVIGSSITMYIFLSRLFRPFASFVGAALLVWAPYRMVQLYVRGAFEETMTYLFLPLIFLSIWMINKKKRLAWVWGGIFLGILFLTQASVSLMFLPSIISLMAILWLKNRSQHVFYQSIKMGLMGFGLSGLVSLPNILERHFIQLDKNIAPIYEKNFIPFDRLINSIWLMIPPPHMLGKAHLLVVVIAFFLIVFVIRKKEKDKTYKWLFFLSFAWSIIPILLALDHPWVKFFWKNILVIRVIYVPYLFLQLATFWTSFLGAYIVDKLNKIGTLLGIVLLLVTIGTNFNYIKPDYYFSIMDFDLTGFNGPLSQFEEFLPKTAQKADTLFNVGDIALSTNKSSQIEVKEQKYHRIRLLVNAKDTDSIVIHQLFFPGWQAKINEKLTNISYTKPVVDSITGKPVSDAGLMLIRIPPGRNEVVLTFHQTLIQIIGTILSFASFLLAIFLLWL